MKITDHYQLNEVKGESCLHFLTCRPVKMVKKGLLLLGEEGEEVRMTYNPQIMEVKIEEKVMDDQPFIRTWGEKLIRIKLVYKNPGSGGRSEVIFR